MKRARAWARSPETRTSVTVMSPAPRTRGSLISSRASTSPRMARTSLATRSTLCVAMLRLPVLVRRLARGEGLAVVEGLQLLLLAQDLGLRADEGQHLVERRLDEPALVADEGQPKGGALP